MSPALRKWLPPLFALAALVAPFTGWMPAYWITLFNYIGLSSLVALGLVLLTGVGGMTSFGQAAFVGFGAYTSAVLTLDYGTSPWLTLPASLLVTALAALGVGLVESFASFWWSTYKEVLVFTIILPVLVWRSFRSSHLEDEE